MTRRTTIYRAAQELRKRAKMVYRTGPYAGMSPEQIRRQPVGKATEESMLPHLFEASTWSHVPDIVEGVVRAPADAANTVVQNVGRLVGDAVNNDHIKLPGVEDRIYRAMEAVDRLNDRYQGMFRPYSQGHEGGGFVDSPGQWLHNVLGLGRNQWNEGGIRGPRPPELPADGNGRDVWISISGAGGSRPGRPGLLRDYPYTSNWRYTDEYYARRYALDAASKGYNVHLSGHSRGGDVADRIAKALVDAGYRPASETLLDPVSSTLLDRHRTVRMPFAKVLMPSSAVNSSGFDPLSDNIAMIGGRMNSSRNASVPWRGSHSRGYAGKLYDALYRALVKRTSGPGEPHRRTSG